MLRLKWLTLISTILAVVIFIHDRKINSTKDLLAGNPLPAEWFAFGDSSLCPKEDMRPADQTFLTYPEWFLVHSPAEQVDYFKTHTATTFPYMGHVAQFWDSYKMVYSPIKNKYPFNTGYHFMIWVIGSSATAEYALKAAYETTIGRLTDTDSGQTMTEEDRFNAVYTQQYVDFI
ncbi:MAG TPA: hypothetical protein VNS32_09855, partial [Flavisolibacter sp.]|nr:hypothetical protein [Flavisolibacter sp.]